MKILLQKQDSIDNVELKLNIKEHLHMSLDMPIKWFEESVARLSLGTEIVMTEYARDLLQQHVKIARLADAAILNYASMASLSRASRSICHKFETAPIEHALAGLVCEDSRANVLRLMKQIESGMQVSFDLYYQKVSKMMMKDRKYFAEHPLSRYF